jgi:hypothetical protein
MMQYIRAVLLCLLALTLCALGQTRRQRVVAIADIHGEFNGFVAILQKTGLIDPSKHWAGGNAILVQTGDIMDRGPKVREVMDLMISLQKEAPRQSGRVIALLGNHETMNMYGDLRYTTSNDWASFAPEHPKAGDSRTDKAHPPGYFERCEALDTEGVYGKWLRSLPAVARVNDSIFLHGGIAPQLAAVPVETINEEVAAEIKAFDMYKHYMIEKKIAAPCSTLEELTSAATSAVAKAKGKDVELLRMFLGYPSWLTIAENGPLWFRGYALWSDSQGAPEIDRLTKAFDVSRFVVGHTVQPEGTITRRFNGKVFLIDTGMLSSYYYNGGRASALNIEDGKVTTIY